MKVRLYDKEFAHINSVCGYDAPAHIEWDRENDQRIACFSERCMDRDTVQGANAAVKVAWLIEPPAIHDYGYRQLIEGGHDEFKYILTFDRRILDALPGKAFWWTPGGTWLWRRDWGVAQKKRGVNIVASLKAWTDAHHLRQVVIEAFSGRFDVYGYGRNPVENKIELRDYRYSVAIENSRLDWYWTDKLLDLFLMGTVPIYRGAPDIGRYFNTDGMLLWDTPDELEGCLDAATPERYESMLPAIHDNYCRALNYAIPEDHLYESFFKRI
jgi:hypothetical protein